MVPTTYLDVSRLLTAGYRNTPSGIERVELAYVQEFGQMDRAEFVASLMRRITMIPRPLVLAYVDAIERLWTAPRRVQHLKTISLMGYIYFVVLLGIISDLLKRQPKPIANNSIYLNLSHENLVTPDTVAKFRSRTGAKLLFFVHDLIPVTHPEYVRDGQSALHRRRMRTVGQLADAVIANSAATKASFIDYLENRIPAVHIAYPGIVRRMKPLSERPHVGQGELPYFLCVATIEPRKNHLLLLNIWRSLAGEFPHGPRLILAGRRGWENEMVLDMLERCETISNLVEERRDLGDDELAELIGGARALLLPSFAEGYGLPVGEALSAGTPVICSDLPALREIGGDVPDYLDPLDGAGWRRAILEYTQERSPRRLAQCERLQSWLAPDWQTHFSQVRAVMDDLVRGQASER